MAAVDEIAIKLGVKTADLKAALASADADIKKFKKSAGSEDANSLAKQFSRAKEGLEKFRSVLAGAGLVALFKQLNDAAVKFAEDYQGSYDEAVASTLRLKESQNDLSSVVSKLVGRVGVELVNAMDKFGIAVGSVIYGTDAAADALNKLEAENRKAFDDAKAKKLREETEKLNKVIRDNTLEQADGNQKINILAGEFVKLLQEQAKLQKGSLEYVQKSIEVEQKRGEVNKAEADQRKKEDDEKKKRDDEREQRRKAASDEELRNLEKLAEMEQKENDSKRERLTLGEQQTKLLREEAQLQAALAEEEKGSVQYNEIYARLLEVRAQFRKTEEAAGKQNLELAKLLLIPERDRSAIEKERIRVLTGETTEYDQQLELSRLLTTGVENLTDAEKERLRILIGQTAEVKKQTDEQKQAAALERLRAEGIKTTGDVRNLSNNKLDDVIGSLTSQLDKIKIADASYHGIGQRSGTYKSVEQYLLQNQLDQALKERNARQSFAQTTSFFGQDFAERQFAPDEFARFSQLFNPDQQRKDSNNLAVVASGLQTLFPDKFNGAIR